MIRVVGALALAVGVLTAGVLLIADNYEDVMGIAASIFTSETRDPPDNQGTYAQTRQAYQAFEDIKQVVRGAEQTAYTCGGTHASFPDRVGHPMLTDLSSYRDQEQVTYLFPHIRRTEVDGMNVSLTSLQVQVQDDGTYELTNVETIESFTSHLTPCFFGYPVHDTKTPVRDAIEELSTEDIDSGTWTKELASPSELQSAKVEQLYWWRDNFAHAETQYADEKILTKNYEDSLPPTGPDEAPYKIPVDAERKGHPILKIDGATQTVQGGEKGYLCFFASGDDNFNLGPDNEKLFTDSYKKMMKLINSRQDIGPMRQCT